MDASGYVYVADPKDNVVRRITSGGILSTFAGTGRSYSVVSGSSNGDGGQANAARLASPRGFVFDASGNLYIVEEFTSRVRRVTPAGIISTFAGVAAK